MAVNLEVCFGRRLLRVRQRGRWLKSGGTGLNASTTKRVFVIETGRGELLGNMTFGHLTRGSCFDCAIEAYGGLPSRRPRPELVLREKAR